MKNAAGTRFQDISFRARLTGAMYIPYILAAVPLALRSRLVVPSDAAATAANIAQSESLYRTTLMTDLLGYALYVVLAYLFYTLLRNVSRPWAAISVLFTLAGCVVQIAATALLTAPLLLLTGNVAHPMALRERQEMALLAIKLFSQAYSIGLFLFGMQWLVMGPLFARLIPLPIGWLLFAGGIGWVVLSSATLIAPSVAQAVRVPVMAVGGPAEIVLGLWLLFKGVRLRSGATSALPRRA